MWFKKKPTVEQLLTTIANGVACNGRRLEKAMATATDLLDRIQKVKDGNDQLARDLATVIGGLKNATDNQAAIDAAVPQLESIAAQLTSEDASLQPAPAPQP